MKQKMVENFLITLYKNFILQSIDICKRKIKNGVRKRQVASFMFIQGKSINIIKTVK